MDANLVTDRTPQKRRIPRKQLLVLRELRRKIVVGEIPAGGRLPTHIELSRQFDVSCVTVQRALDRLAHEGLLESRGRSGTFVTDRLPHLSNYGLVFPDRPSAGSGWRSRFWAALTQEWVSLQAQGTRRMSIYFGVRPDGDPADIAKLRDDLREHRLAGLLLVVARVSLPVIRDLAGSLAVAGFGDGAGQWLPVNMQGDRWNERAVQWLAERGRKRIAIVNASMQSSEYIAGLIRLIEQHGMSTRAPWVQAISPTEAVWARNCTHLLMDRPKDYRPDGLLIADDNLVEHAVGGLIDAGARVPDDLDVVAHCNFPWPAPSVLPVRRLGYDIRKMVRDTLELIDARQRGEAKPDRVNAPAVFEEEATSQVPAEADAH